MNLRLISIALIIAFAMQVNADDKQEVEITRIKANKELPKVLYVVPWKDMETYKNSDQKLVLHDFLGDLYEPVIPSNTVLTDKADKSDADITKPKL